MFSVWHSSSLAIANLIFFSVFIRTNGNFPFDVNFLIYLLLSQISVRHAHYLYMTAFHLFLFLFLFLLHYFVIHLSCSPWLFAHPLSIFFNFLALSIYLLLYLSLSFTLSISLSLSSSLFIPSLQRFCGMRCSCWCRCCIWCPYRYYH